MIGKMHNYIHQLFSSEDGWCFFEKYVRNLDLLYHSYKIIVAVNIAGTDGGFYEKQDLWLYTGINNIAKLFSSMDCYEEFWHSGKLYICR